MPKPVIRWRKVRLFTRQVRILICQEFETFWKGETVSNLSSNFDWSKHNYQSGERASIPKEEIVELFKFVETGAITEKEFCEMATEIIERAVARPPALEVVT